MNVGRVTSGKEALDAHPARIGTTLLFSTQNGTPIDLHRWRSRQWTPALEDLREVVRRWDRNIATHEVWDEAEGHWVNPDTEANELG